MARRNTAAQEAFISSLNTRGALDEGSGFDPNFRPGETNEAFAARLAEFQRKDAAPQGSAATAPSGGVPSAAAAGAGSLAGIQAAAGDAPVPDVSAGANEVAARTLASIAKALARRSPPSEEYVLRPRMY